MKDIELPDPVGFRSRYRSEPGMIGHYPWTYADHRRRKYDRPECEYEDLYTADQLRAAVEADRAQRVPDGWVQVTQHLLNSQEPWLYKPCWLAFPSGAVLRGVYEWRQGRNPDRFISDEVGDVWAFDVSHVMPVSTPPHPSKALLASTPAPAQQEPNWWRKRADEIDVTVARSGSTEAMRCFTDMRTLLQAATAHQEPPQQERKPMTPEQVGIVCDSAGYLENGMAKTDFINGIRHAERHHGIKE